MARGFSEHPTAKTMALKAMVYCGTGASKGPSFLSFDMLHAAYTDPSCGLFLRRGAWCELRMC